MLVYETEQQVYEAAKEAASKIIPVPVGDVSNFYIHTRTTAKGYTYHVLCNKEAKFTSAEAFVQGGKCWTYWPTGYDSNQYTMLHIVADLLIGCSPFVNGALSSEDILDALNAAEETVVNLKADRN